MKSSLSLLPGSKLAVRDSFGLVGYVKIGRSKTASISPLTDIAITTVRN